MFIYFRFLPIVLVVGIALSACGGGVGRDFGVNEGEVESDLPRLHASRGGVGPCVENICMGSHFGDESARCSSVGEANVNGDIRLCRGVIDSVAGINVLGSELLTFSGKAARMEIYFSSSDYNAMKERLGGVLEISDQQLEGFDYHRGRYENMGILERRHMGVIPRTQVTWRADNGEMILYRSFVDSNSVLVVNSSPMLWVVEEAARNVSKDSFR